MLKKILSYFQPKQRKFKISFHAVFTENNELFDVYTIEAPTEKAARRKITKQFNRVELFSINRVTEI
jgi:hypothetical protein